MGVISKTQHIFISLLQNSKTKVVHSEWQTQEMLTSETICCNKFSCGSSSHLSPNSSVEPTDPDRLVPCPLFTHDCKVGWQSLKCSNSTPYRFLMQNGCMGRNSFHIFCLLSPWIACYRQELTSWWLISSTCCTGIPLPVISFLRSGK